jgi:uncharacterized membrane protein YhdT
MKTLSNLFKIASYVAMLGWVILVCLPTWQLADKVITSIIVTLLCILYVYLLFFAKNSSNEKYPKGGFMSLGGVINLFKNPRMILAGWIHYLAFDLMIGLYIKNSANQAGISHWLQIPCFLLTLMFGPMGLLMYLIIQYVFVYF